MCEVRWAFYNSFEHSSVAQIWFIIKDYYNNPLIKQCIRYILKNTDNSIHWNIRLLFLLYTAALNRILKFLTSWSGMFIVRNEKQSLFFPTRTDQIYWLPFEFPAIHMVSRQRCSCFTEILSSLKQGFEQYSWAYSTVYSVVLASTANSTTTVCSCVFAWLCVADVLNKSEVLLARCKINEWM